MGCGARSGFIFEFGRRRLRRDLVGVIHRARTMVPCRLGSSGLRRNATISGNARFSRMAVSTVPRLAGLSRSVETSRSQRVWVRVRGIGVAVMTSISEHLRARSSARCKTPNLCCSSMTTKPKPQIAGVAERVRSDDDLEGVQFTCILLPTLKPYPRILFACVDEAGLPRLSNRRSKTSPADPARIGLPDQRIPSPKLDSWFFPIC